MVIEPVDYVPHEYGPLATGFMLSNRYCALWAKPGMGKTPLVYATLDILKIAGSNFFPALVLAPKKVCELTWPVQQKKFKQFAGLQIVPLFGTKAQREQRLLQRGDIYVINYELLPWLVSRLRGAWPFKMLILDESTKVKNHRMKGGGIRSAALAGLVDKFGRVIELSGTPSPNGLKDLWGQIYFLDKGQRLGRTYTDFINRWFRVDAYTGAIVPKKNAEVEIYAAIADITLALRPEDWFDIDEPIIIQRPIELPQEARNLYDEMEEKFYLDLGDEREIDAVNAMALSTKLLQIASGTVYDNEKAVHFVHDAKIEDLKSIIEESGGEPVLTVYQYRSQIEALKAAIPGTRVFRTKQDQDDWNNGKIQHMLLHPANGGHGVDLQDGGRTMVFFTPTYNAEHRSQVIERIGSMRQIQSGHPRAVMIYDILAKNTIDDEASAVMDGKLTVQESLMAARAVRL